MWNYESWPCGNSIHFFFENTNSIYHLRCLVSVHSCNAIDKNSNSHHGSRHKKCSVKSWKMNQQHMYATVWWQSSHIYCWKRKQQVQGIQLSVVNLLPLFEVYGKFIALRTMYFWLLAFFMYIVYIREYFDTGLYEAYQATQSIHQSSLRSML